MLIMVCGGSASGKSAIAEDLAVKTTGKRLYIATMQIEDEECEIRVARHRNMRAGKGFTSLESPLNIGEKVQVAADYDTVLLECLATLFANTMYIQGKNAKESEEKIKRELEELKSTVDTLIVVTNEVFSDGMDYNEFTEEYLTGLARLNIALATMADVVIESVCNIALVHKGKEVLNI